MSNNCTISVTLPTIEIEQLDRIAALKKTSRSKLSQQYVRTGLVRTLNPEDIARRCDQLKADLLQAAKVFNAN